MIQKPIDRIATEDIESLVTAKVSERRTLDYKLQLPGNTDAEKREFLYDASSFANAAGGDMVFGITDERDAAGKPTGLPASADGIAMPNPSEVILRLENLVRDGIDPRLPGIQWQQVEGFPKGPVLVMRIPKSWIGPHMVTFSGVSRFYSRNSAGKYPLDIREIRAAFLAQTAVGERIRRFVVERVSKTIQGESPIPFSDGAKFLLHLIPVSALDSINVRDVTKAAARLHTELAPIHAGSWGHRFNFDGVLISGGRANSYVQVFRSGIIEAGEGRVFTHNQSIPSIGFEQSICNATERYLKVQKKLDLPVPIFVVITLISVKGFRLGLDEWFLITHNVEPATIDRDTLFLPETIVENYASNAAGMLRPAFDALWQACGFEQSFNYDKDGNWKPHQ